MTSLRPIGERIAVQRVEAESVTRGGIVLPDGAKEKPTRGVVVGVGEGAVAVNGARIKPLVQVGDMVLFTKYAGEDYRLDDKTIAMVRESDILAVLTEV